MKNNDRRRLQLLEDVKVIRHKEYNHELVKFYKKKRYVKDDIKKFRNKRIRRKLKQNLKLEVLS